MDLDQMLAGLKIHYGIDVLAAVQAHEGRAEGIPGTWSIREGRLFYAPDPGTLPPFDCQP